MKIHMREARSSLLVHGTLMDRHKTIISDDEHQIPSYIKLYPVTALYETCDNTEKKFKSIMNSVSGYTHFRT